MSRVHRATALGLSLIALVPCATRAQQSGRHGPLPAGSPRPNPQPLVGFGSLRPPEGTRRPSWDAQRHIFGPAPFATFRSGSIGTLFFGSPYRQAYPTVVPTAVPYAVPYYVPVPVYVRSYRYRGDTTAPVTKYDPAKSKTLIIGAGADGGGGVMRIQRLDHSVLRLIWLGSMRPVREAQLFLADSLRYPLRTQSVDSARPIADFTVSGFEREIAFAALTVVYADGVTVTTLVPYPDKPPRAPFDRPE